MRVWATTIGVNARYPHADVGQMREMLPMLSFSEVLKCSSRNFC